MEIMEQGYLLKVFFTYKIKILPNKIKHFYNLIIKQYN